MEGYARLCITARESKALISADERAIRFGVSHLALRL
jgi:hypothetical protein